MKLLIDAQLPRRMTQWFAIERCDATHTLDLPARNRTTDVDVIALADTDGRAVVSKDSDFVDSHLLHTRPRRLLLISTGNISNDQLEALIAPLIPSITREFNSCRFIELARTGLIVRG